MVSTPFSRHLKKGGQSGFSQFGSVHQPFVKKKKSLLPISQDKQKKYQPGNCGWETVSGIKKFIAYSFPMLRTMIQESLGVF